MSCFSPLRICIEDAWLAEVLKGIASVPPPVKVFTERLARVSKHDTVLLFSKDAIRLRVLGWKQK